MLIFFLIALILQSVQNSFIQNIFVKSKLFGAKTTPAKVDTILEEEVLKQILINQSGTMPILGGTEYDPLPDIEGSIVSVEETAKEFGFEVTEHEITTKDGFVLQLHNFKSSKENRKVVFLLHGLFGSADDWLAVGKHSLPYYLLDENFDVWLGNVRGSKYGKSHTSVSQDCDEYWDFSWHEIGLIDVPVSIKYVLKKTNATKLYFVGYSAGATEAFVALSQHEALNNKIELFIAVAPIVFLSNAKSPVLRLLAAINDDEVVRKLIGTEDFKALGFLGKPLTNILCHKGLKTREICRNILFKICGFNLNNTDTEYLPNVLRRKILGSSNTLLHFVQNARSGLFRQFDYNSTINYDKYETTTPPNYNLNAVTAPVAIIYGKNDWLADLNDVEILQRTLPNVVDTAVVKGFTHMDFLYGVNVKKQLHDKILKLLKKYDKQS